LIPFLRRSLAAALAASVLAAAPARAADEPAATAPPPPVFSFGEAGALAAGDATGVLLAPLHWDGTDWLKFGGAAAAVVATGFLLDNRLHDASQRSRTTSRDDAAVTIQKFGAEYSFAVLGGFAVVGLAGKNREAMNIAVDGLLSSVIAAGVVGPFFKVAMGRARPNAGEGPDSFSPFSSNASFPSGHTTQAFAVASVVAAHDGRLWVSVLSYGLAGSVGFARIEQDAHWSSDVLAGAILGTVVGNAVVKVNERIRAGRASDSRGEGDSGPSLSLGPVLLRKGGGLSVVASF
jgi:membrane-associated phospholipid phosphatase